MQEAVDQKTAEARRPEQVQQAVKAAQTEEEQPTARGEQQYLFLLPASLRSSQNRLPLAADPLPTAQKSVESGLQPKAPEQAQAIDSRESADMTAAVVQEHPAQAPVDERPVAVEDAKPMYTFCPIISSVRLSEHKIDTVACPAS